jgi:hypothetical protein
MGRGLPVSFKPIQIPANADAQALASVVQRFQQNVASEFIVVETARDVLPVANVTATSSVGVYQVKSSDQYLVVNVSGGPMRIVLPVPARATQAVWVLNAQGGNSLTVAQGDSKTMGDGSTSVSLAKSESALMVCDGRAWWRFGK